jgi:peptidylprolyl isomerase
LIGNWNSFKECISIIGYIKEMTTMPTSKGDFIIMDYTAKVKETNEIFDTSTSDTAKKANIFRENIIYEPMLVVIGENWVLKGLDEKLVGQEAGTKTQIEVPPDKGFGTRDPSKIKLVPLRRFRDQKVALYPGLEVEFEGKLAVVRSVGAGRVQLDFNPPLAGKTLIYDIEIKQILQTPLEKIKALIHRRIPLVDINKIDVEISEKNVTIKIPEEAFALEGLQLAKRGIAADIHKFFQEIDKVIFIENFERKVAKPSTMKEEAKPQPTASQT